MKRSVSEIHWKDLLLILSLGTVLLREPSTLILSRVIPIIVISLRYRLQTAKSRLKHLSAGTHEVKFLGIIKLHFDLRGPLVLEAYVTTAL